MRIFAPLAAAILAASCVTAVGTGYQAVGAKQPYGYADQKIEADRYRITFAGDGATPPDVVEDFAMLRAADLAIAGGYDWFRVAARSVNEEEKGGVGVGAGLGTGSYGRNTAVGIGVGGNLGAIGARKFYTARLDVLFGKGAKPDGDYDARSVASEIRARRGL
jgi:hypothetical protein